MTYKRKPGRPKKHESERGYNLGGHKIPNRDYLSICQIAKAYDTTPNKIMRRIIREGIEKHQVLEIFEEKIKEDKARLETDIKNKDMYVEERMRGLDIAKVRLMEFFKANLDLIKSRKLSEKRVHDVLIDISWETGIDMDYIETIWISTAERYNQEMQSEPEAQVKAMT